MAARNSDAFARTWTHIQRADGTTLHLAPGEVAEDVEAPLGDPYLKPIPKRKGATAPEPAPLEVPEPQPEKE